jgi:hypothetical protein
MKKLAAAAFLLTSAAWGQDQPNLAQVRDDAKVMKRVVDVAKKDVPRDILETIAREDLELLRGPRPDKSYVWADYVREEAGRKEEGFTVAGGEKQTTVRHRGELVYKLIVRPPTRRYVVRKNQRVFIDRIDLDISPVEDMPSRVQTVEVDEWLAPGQSREVELPEIARVARVTVLANTEAKAGPASLELTFVQAKLADNPASPWSRPVENLKLFLQALDRGDRGNMRTTANLLVTDPTLGTDARVSIPERELRVTQEDLPLDSRPGSTALSGSELYIELQTIEDLLTGSESERRQGLDLLHQLVRRVRPERYVR